MPHVRYQDSTAPPSKLGLYALDEVPSDTTASRFPRNDQLAQICPEAKVMGTDEAHDRGVFLPNERQVAAGLDASCEGRVGPIVVPQPRLRFHEQPNGRNVVACRLTNHTRHSFVSG